MAFHFPLEAILRFRRGLERVERLKLETIASEQAQARRQLEMMTQQFFELRHRFQQAMRNEISGSELQFEAMQTERFALARLALRKRLTELEEQRVKQVEAYTKARQNREILENLRSGKFELYRQTLSRREQQELDDLFLVRHDFAHHE